MSEKREENRPEISIIVPVYKVEKYLNECIDSILAQTFTDFELILVTTAPRTTALPCVMRRQPRTAASGSATSRTRA